MTTTRTADRLLTASQAAGLLCLSLRTFFRYVKMGKLPAAAYRRNRKVVRWDAGEVAAAGRLLR